MLDTTIGKSIYFYFMRNQEDHNYPRNTSPVHPLSKLCLYIIIFGATLTHTFGQWGSIPTDTGITLTDLHFVDIMNGLVIGEQGLILRTTDGGSNWTFPNSGISEHLNSVHFITSNKAFIAADKGMLLSTTNGGNNWSKETLDTTINLNHVYFANSDKGFLVGDNGVIYQTVDGGDDWVLQTPTVVNLLTAVDFPDQSTGFITGSSGTVLKSTNGGDNWTKLNSLSTNAYLSDVFFFAPDSGYVVGNQGTIFRTTDAGGTWQPQSSPVTEWLKGIHCPETDNCFIAGNNGTILTTSDGLNWTTINTGLSVHLERIQYIDEHTGYITGANGTLLQTCPNAKFSATKTLDLGITDTIHFRNKSTSSTLSFWDFGDGQTSTDSDPIHKFTQTGEFTVWLYASNASDCYDSTSLKITVDNTNPVAPVKFEEGFEVFPNPFRTSFSIEHNQAIRVELFDVSGKLLLTGTYGPGITHLDPQSLSALPEGAYFLKITDNHRSQVTKLIRID